MRLIKWDGPGRACRWRYALVVDDVAAEGFFCESYGVTISDARTGAECRRRHVTTSALDAAALLDALARGQVSPVTLDDVLEDWLAR